MRGHAAFEGRIVGGRYRLEGLLGEGGFGAVYRATNLTMDQVVAVKLLHGHVDDPGQQQRFEREARTTCKLRHPNTIRVFDFGRTDEGELFMVMEHLEGSPLSRPLRQEAPFAPARAAHIAAQVCKSLAEAHDAGLVHRDLKPDNIFLTPMVGDADFVKVLDFGIAKVADQASQQLTATGTVLGTPRYLSPEQAMDRPLDGRSDLYALGVILFEMLAGRPPFEADSALALLLKHAHEEPPDLEALSPAGDAGYDRLVPIVRRLLLKDPGLRFASAHMTLAALEEALLSMPSTSTGQRLAARRGHAMSMVDEVGAESGRQLPAPDTGQLPAAARETGESRAAGGVGAVVRVGLPGGEPQLHEAATLAHQGAAPASPSAVAEASAAAAPMWRRGWFVGLVVGLALAAVGFGGWYVTRQTAPGPRSPTPERLGNEEPTVAAPGGGSRAEDPGAVAVAALDPVWAAGIFGPKGMAVGSALDRGLGEAGRRAAELAVRWATPSFVEIVSEPAGAAVAVDGERAGRTPVKVDWSPGSPPLAITVSKAGYRVHEGFAPLSSRGGTHAVQLEKEAETGASSPHARRGSAADRGSGEAAAGGAVATQAPDPEETPPVTPEGDKPFQMVE